tara:strand:- start:323 stop:496 length:174 start_codon:yes stop_codon:yes gene_type:complete
MANKFHRQKFSTGSSIKRDFPGLRESKKDFKKFLQKYKNKPLDIDAVFKSYKIFKKK